MMTQTMPPLRLRPPRRGQREAVEMQEKRFGYFPKRFRWRGQIFSVAAVERCWHTTQHNPYLCFRVRCPEGTFDLFQNVRTNIWELLPRQV